MPPKPIRTLRNLTRYRKSQHPRAPAEANRLHKMLEDTGIKLDCVATDLLGSLGRAMLDALVAGTTDPHAARRPRARSAAHEAPGAAEALEGRFDASTRSSSGDPRPPRLPGRVDRPLSAAIEEQIAPFAAAVELLCTIPGVQRRAAEVIIAETGAT